MWLPMQVKSDAIYSSDPLCCCLCPCCQTNIDAACSLIGLVQTIKLLLLFQKVCKLKLKPCAQLLSKSSLLKSDPAWLALRCYVHVKLEQLGIIHFFDDFL